MIYFIPGLGTTSELFKPLGDCIQKQFAIDQCPSLIFPDHPGMGVRYHEFTSDLECDDALRMLTSDIISDEVQLSEELNKLYKNASWNYSLKDLAGMHFKIFLEKISANQFASQKIIFVGASMGGFILSHLGLLLREELEKEQSILKNFRGKFHFVFLCSLGPINKGFTSPTPLTEKGLIQFFQLPNEVRAKIQTDYSIGPNLITQNPKRYEEIYQYRLNAKVSPIHTLLQNKAAIDYLESSMDFQKLEFFPGFVIHGLNDTFVLPENSQQYKKCFPHWENINLEDAGHLVMMEKAEEISQILSTIFHKDFQ